MKNKVEIVAPEIPKTDLTVSSEIVAITPNIIPEIVEEFFNVLEKTKVKNTLMKTQQDLRMDYKMDTGIDAYNLETNYAIIETDDDTVETTMKESFPEVLEYIHWLETKICNNEI